MQQVFPWGLGPPIVNANDISIASAVFAGLTRWHTDWQTDRPRYSVGRNRRSAQWRSQILLSFIRLQQVFTGAVDSTDRMNFSNQQLYSAVRLDARPCNGFCYVTARYKLSCYYYYYHYKSPDDDDDDDDAAGARCQLVDYCASQPCRNGGRCSSTVDSFRCRCMSGYVGRTCADDLNECHTQPCDNGGTCVNTVGSYR